MSVSFSAIDLQTRLEVQDLLSRFCHALDRNLTKEWIDLFTEGAYIEAPRFGKFTGRNEIAKIPELVRESGKGCWRHYLSNMYMDRASNSRDVLVEAYCTVGDWSTKGNVVRSWDVSARVGKRRGWKIISLRLSAVKAYEPGASVSVQSSDILIGAETINARTSYPTDLILR